jgi:DNA-binding MarR family transcriptional regulator
MRPTSARRARKPATAPAAERLDRSELDRALGFRLREALAESERAFQACFREEKISSAVYAILTVVGANPGCRPSDLCREILISPTNIVPYLDDLAERGLLLREEDPRDRRSKRLTLTLEGRDYLGRLRLMHRRITADLERRIGERELAQLLDLLSRLPSES